ncbi:hypothetical protein [Dactylosporangium sp. NPDC005555]|uniref:hypothetical protein n=1 Tax=Dactylosporangium sp. NPDC005555 TaxID=3154889 RepID=UPI0033A6FE04
MPRQNVEVSPTDETLADRLRALRMIGFTVLNFKVSGPDRDGQIERLAREVLPDVR